ncbi:MAG: 2-hydroxychromene-2-carboxylate isomerase [Gammaproteobacteria bacterium]|jgi:2-hydroxychromene-2-carboxylate isomerase|nr:MAG: disulfide bond formation protein DsbA [Gammaproteobacteria bacterium TMED234]|tara:strand:+ start:1221 stop:1820 length:600 start_codon:yes stop_codon:yes gene_type:complete
MIVDFIFDVASPNTYFAHKLIPNFEKRTGTKFRYIPCLLGGIHKLTNNQPPFIAYADCENKNNYQMIEIERFVKQHKLTKYKFNSHFPPVTIQVQRGAIAAQRLKIFEEYFECVISAMWENDKNISDINILHETLEQSNLDVAAIMNIATSQECKDKLIANTDDAVSRGAFGAPTFFYENQIFFGKDHLYQLEEYINSN